MPTSAMQGARIFIDSTTFLYTFDRREPKKGVLALKWLFELRKADCGLTNLQVLNEIANVATRNRAHFGDEPFLNIDAFAMFGTTPVNFDTALAARNIHKRYRYSWWDCLLLASAIELGCTHFLSEDLQDGQIIDGPTTKGLTIVDPFAHTPEQILVSP